LLRRIDRSVQGYTLGTPQDFDRLEEYLS
jgi:hypothetical protein